MGTGTPVRDPLHQPGGPREGRPTRVGVFGGTFDPPHRGHVTVAKDVADALGLDRVLWVVARVPPHKSDEAVTDAALRREMVVEAVATDARFEVSDMELARPGPSWTVDTLRTLRAIHPDAELFLILGADQLRTFASGWRDPEAILELATLAVMDRAGESAALVATDLPGMQRAVHVPVTRVDLSSSEVRALRRGGRDVSSMLPPRVHDVIMREALYVG
jgi:nicotinate-nucleotide adenylyltransferase